MFKKILLILMISLLGFGVIGCSDSKEDTNEVVKKETEEKLDEESTSEDIYNKKLQFLNDTKNQSEIIGDEIRLLTEKDNNYEIVKSDWKEDLISKKKIITDLKSVLEEEKSNILDGVSDFQKTILQNKYNEIIEYYDYMLKGISQNLNI
ncbi:hypothetical protein BGU81_06510 [Clostridioides difficile]|nr:hypothetical protein BGU81_06510 [Clostridioides difficile]